MNGLSFIKQYITKPRTVGAILPSSKYLADKMVETIDFNSARHIVEYGPGTGVFTDKILEVRKRDTIILLFETNEVFYNLLQEKYKNEINLYIINDSAEYIGKYMARYHIPWVDYIVSGLPFTSLPKTVSANILKQTQLHLRQDGRFILFQYTLFKKKLIEQYFNTIEITREWRNMPPAYVFSCGNYRIVSGADVANSDKAGKLHDRRGNKDLIKFYNRQTGEYEMEKVAGAGVLQYLYGTGFGKAGLELLIKRKIFSRISGFFCDSRFSVKRIPGFIASYDIDMSLCEKEAEEFKSFNEFFIRKLRRDARVFTENPELLLCPGDGRLKAWMDIDVEQLVQIKGSTYSLQELIGEERLASGYSRGICLLLRLAPVDYHRYHFIDEGVCKESHRIKGSYYSVNPIALETVVNVFCRNKREYSILHSENFGKILFVEVGAASVGSIVQTYIPGKKVDRGDEKGYFKFGGSTVLLFLENDRAVIDRDILEQTKIGYETRVMAGERIGCQ